MTLLPMYRMLHSLQNKHIHFLFGASRCLRKVVRTGADTLIAHVMGFILALRPGTERGQKAGLPRWGLGWRLTQAGEDSWLLAPHLPHLSRVAPMRVEEGDVVQSQDDLIGAGDHLDVKQPVPGRERKSSSPRGPRSVRGGQLGGNAVSGEGSHPQITHPLGLRQPSRPPSFSPSPFIYS